MKRLFALFSIILIIFGAYGQSTPTVILNSSVDSNISPVTPTLTWSSNGVTSCTASSSPTDPKWSGTVATSGSLAVGPITTTTVYTLTCSSITDTNATFSWSPPTTNTDGTPLTDLAGFKLYSGANGVGTLVTTITSPSATSYQLTGLAVGNYSWYLTAYNSSNIESGPSNNATKSIVAGGSAAQNVTVQITKKSAPPTKLTVQ